MATPTIPDWPSYTDDDLVSDNGTDIDVAFLDAIGNAVQDSITGANNPSVYASMTIDEVITARAGYADLDERLDQPVVGTINTTVSASDIVDEVVAARDDNPDLDDRLNNFVDDEIPDAESAVRGLVANDAQSWDGEKTFTTQPLARPGAATSTSLRLSGTIALDGTSHTVTDTVETDTTSVTLAPNTLSRNGQAIRFRVWGKTASAGSKSIRVYWDGTAIASLVATVIAGTYEIVGVIQRVSASVQTAIISIGKLADTLNDLTGVNLAPLTYHWDGSAAPMDADLTGSVILKFTIQNNTDGDADVTQLGCIVEILG